MGGIANTKKPTPLARLLLLSYRLIIDRLHQRLRDEGWTDVRPAYGFVLLATRDRPITTTELASVLGVTKQAVSKLVDAMDGSGYVHRRVDPEDARLKIVELAPRGWQLLTVVEGIYSDIESDWSALLGDKTVEQIRQNLSRVVLEASGGEFPAIRATL